MYESDAGDDWIILVDQGKEPPAPEAAPPIQAAPLPEAHLPQSAAPTVSALPAAPPAAISAAPASATATAPAAEHNLLDGGEPAAEDKNNGTPPPILDYPLEWATTPHVVSSIYNPSEAAPIPSAPPLSIKSPSEADNEEAELQPGLDNEEEIAEQKHPTPLKPEPIAPVINEMQEDKDPFVQTIQQLQTMQGMKDVPSSLFNACLAQRDLDAQDEKGMTLLMHAVEKRDIHAVRLLLEKGANPDTQNLQGQTALMLSAQTNNTRAMLLLLEYGANLDLQDNQNKTALMYAHGKDDQSKGDNKYRSVTRLLLNAAKQAKKKPKPAVINETKPGLVSKLFSGWGKKKAAEQPSVPPKEEKEEEEYEYKRPDKPVFKEPIGALAAPALPLDQIPAELTHAQHITGIAMPIDEEQKQDPQQLKADILHAAQTGDTATLYRLLDNMPDENQQAQYRQEALNVARQYEQPDAIYVLEATFDAKIMEAGLLGAAKTGDTFTLYFCLERLEKLVLEKIEDSKEQEKQREKILEKALKEARTHNQRAIVQLLNLWDKKTAPHSKEGDEEPDHVRDNRNFTPEIVYALNKGGQSAQQALQGWIKEGKNINTPTDQRRGMTLLMHAAAEGLDTAIKILMQNQADPHLPDARGDSALMHAAGKGRVGAINLLLDNNNARVIDINAKGSLGWTALMHAAATGQAETVHLLLQRGANISATSVDGKTALYYAEQGKYRGEGGRAAAATIKQLKAWEAYRVEYAAWEAKQKAGDGSVVSHLHAEEKHEPPKSKAVDPAELAHRETVARAALPLVSMLVSAIAQNQASPQSPEAKPNPWDNGSWNWY